jgi:hypothetical protein
MDAGHGSRLVADGKPTWLERAIRSRLQGGLPPGGEEGDGADDLELDRSQLSG